MGGSIAPEKILRELSDLWVTLSKETHGDAADGALRACSMTLVALTEESDDIAELGETIAALMPQHPARAIVARLRGAGERMLSERVSAQCWMPFGQHRKVCCERVEITATDAALAGFALGGAAAGGSRSAADSLVPERADSRDAGVPAHRSDGAKSHSR